jgi:hypothetical protein
MKRQSMGWTIVTLAILAAALAVAYAAPGGDEAKAPAAGCQMGSCPGGGACPCKCGCADGKPCTCGKDCACQCGCAEGKPCACGAGGCKMASGACPMMGAKMATDTAPVKVSAESEKLWKQLGAAMALRHQKMWELFALQGADKPDQKAIDAKLAEIAELDRQMSVARGGLYQYRVAGKGAAMGGGCGMGSGMGSGMGGGMGHGKMMRMGAGGCGGGCAGAR